MSVRKQSNDLNSSGAHAQALPGHAPVRLPHPVRITEQKWPDETEPVVSVLCITYNHEKFISECLNGFLIQETTFPVEIIVHDDASTDRTGDIVREYQLRYPQLFRTILQTENQHSKKRPIIGIALPLARGKYFAYCEGDDFWTYSQKLEKQVCMLSGMPELAMVSHKWSLITQDSTEVSASERLLSDAPIQYSDKDVLRGVFDHPNTWVVRKQTLSSEFLHLLSCLPMGDDPWNLFFLQEGKKGLSLPVIWSVYRQHPGGIWSTLGVFQKMSQQLALFVSEKNFYAPRYTREYQSIISNQRMGLARMLGTELIHARMHQSLKNLRYLASFRSAFFPVFSEVVRLMLLGICVAAYVGSKNVLRRLARQVGLLPLKTGPSP
jgi:glycosyltransferase involved in cell wall biosynthesis